MRLFIEFYLDEDVSILLSELLRHRGFKALTTRDAKMLGKSDTEQLAYAVSQRKVLLTHNRVDFERLHTEYLKAGREHYGIIIARRSNEHTILKRLLKILNQVPADEMKNQLKYI
jgi:predicted nuclease of predicted toxin-antitoxin system